MEEKPQGSLFVDLNLVLTDFLEPWVTKMREGKILKVG
jgi:hypothetical protein